MTIDWLTPAVLAGLLLLVVPVAAHLYARTPVRRLVVPSLRPVDPGRLRVHRRRHLRHPSLLLVRLATVAAAVAAAAGPLVTTPQRSAAWAARTARAVVIDRGVPPSAVEAAVAAERAETTAVEVFGADPVDGAIPLALAWLDRQGPARRELVVIGDDASAPGAAALARVPPEIGVRVRAVHGQAAADVPRLWLGGDADGRLRARRVVADGEAASVAAFGEPLPTLPVRVIAPDSDQDHLDAVLEGVVADGVFLRDPSTWRSLELEWTTAPPPRPTTTSLDAADRAVLWPLAVALGDGEATPAETAPWTRVGPDVLAARRGDAIALRVARPVETRHAAAVLGAAVSVAAGERDLPRLARRLTAEQRAALERPPGAVPGGAARFATGRDGRWLWAVVALLLVVEMALRRRLETAAPPAAADAAGGGSA
ncbi:MAG: BatA domain-containing protein [Vicinamibacterales bacterium]